MLNPLHPLSNPLSPKSREVLPDRAGDISEAIPWPRVLQAEPLWLWLSFSWIFRVGLLQWGLQLWPCTFGPVLWNSGLGAWRSLVVERLSMLHSTILSTPIKDQ